MFMAYFNRYCMVDKPGNDLVRHIVVISYWYRSGISFLGETNISNKQCSLLTRITFKEESEQKSLPVLTSHCPDD